MPEELLYEYATIRYVPRVEREEFINIGLIMMCKRKRWIRCAFEINERRLAVFDNPFDDCTLSRQVEAFGAIAAGARGYGEMAALPVEERFRWLTAVKSACLQTSRPHPGKSYDLEQTFDRLYAELVK